MMEVNTREKEEAKDLTIEFRYFRMQPVISPRKTELEMGRESKNIRQNGEESKKVEIM